MISAIRPTGTARSFPVGTLLAGFVSMIITFILGSIIAKSIHIEKITWEQAGYWIMITIFVASFLGGKYAIKLIKHQNLMISIAAGIIYWGLLLCITALFFGGKFDAVLETAGIILSGSVSAALISKPKRKKTTTRIKRK